MISGEIIWTAACLFLIRRHRTGSGCGCAAVTLASYIYPKLRDGEWERVLFVPTGALLSTVIYNEGASVPGIAHAIILEHAAPGR